MTITNSALVNDTTNIVENICVSVPVTPSPYGGLFMVGLEDPVYETQTTTNTATHASGSTFSVNADGSVTVTLPNGTKKSFRLEQLLLSMQTALSQPHTRRPSRF